MIKLLNFCQNGVERGDILDELCGDPVLSSTHGRVNTTMFDIPINFTL